MTGKRNRHRWSRRLRVPVALAATSGLGATLALLGSQGGGSAHLSENTGHPIPYTHSGDDCGFFDRKDPINVVFQGDLANYVSVRAEAAAHSFWLVNGGEEQYFLDHGDCKEMHDASASASESAPVSRWHMRYLQGPQPDPTWGIYTVAAAHREDAIPFPDCPFPFRHATDGNLNEPPGGFNKGRAEVFNDWVVFPGDSHPGIFHSLLFPIENWDNTQPFEQCDGDIAWSDGLVYFISMSAGGPPSGGNKGGFGSPF